GDSVEDIGAADAQLLAANLRCVDNPARHHRPVGHPVGELDLTCGLVEAISQVGTALLAKPLECRPQVGIFDVVVPLNPKVVRTDEPYRHWLLDKPLTVRSVQDSLDHL